METLDFIRNGGETRRYHTIPVLRSQNVAEHSFHVAMLCSWLVGHSVPGIGAALLMAALTHDLAEHKMGDLPAPVKRSLPDYEQSEGEARPFRQVWDDLEQEHLEAAELNWDHVLTPFERRILKLADAAEGCLYCIRERAMGNRLITEVFGNFLSYTEKLINDRTVGVNEAQCDQEATLLAYINFEWSKANDPA